MTTFDLLSIMALLLFGMGFVPSCGGDDDDEDNDADAEGADDDSGGDLGADDDAGDNTGDDDMSPPPGWRMQLVDDQGPFGDVRLLLTSTGAPHLTYGVYPSGQDAMLKHASSEQGVWSRKTVWTFALGAGYHAMALRDDEPVIAYQRYVDLIAGKNQLVLADKSSGVWTEALVWEDVFDAYDISLLVADEVRVVFDDRATFDDAAVASVWQAQGAEGEWLVSEQLPGFSPAAGAAPDGAAQIVAFVDVNDERAPAEQRGKLLLWTAGDKGWSGEAIDDVADHDLPFESEAFFSDPLVGADASGEPSAAYHFGMIAPSSPEHEIKSSVVLARRTDGVWETESLCDSCYLKGFRQKSIAVRRLVFVGEDQQLALAEDSTGSWVKETLGLPNGYVGFDVDEDGYSYIGYAPAPQGVAERLYVLTNRPE